MDQSIPKTTVRISLLKRVTEYDDAIDQVETLRSREFPDYNAKLFWKPPSSSVAPTWVRNIFANEHDLQESLTTKTVSAVLVVKHSDRYFAFTFGYGRSLLRQSCIEPRFGLKTVLNRVDPESLRSIDRKSLDGFLSHTREQVPSLSPITSFGIDIEKDFIKTVTGTSKVQEIGTTITGSDAYCASLPITLQNIHIKLDRLATAYEDDVYKDNFEFIDNIAEVPTSLSRELDEKLVEKIVAGEHDKVWLAPPEIVDWENHGGFSFVPSGRPYDDIGLDYYIQERVSDIGALDAEKLKRDRIFQLDSTYRYENQKWPVYKCLYAEIPDGEKLFVLSDGKWFEVNPSYVTRITDYLRINLDSWDGEPFPEYDSSGMVMPDDEGRKGEARYNAQVASSSEFTLMDAKNIMHGGANSRIELCDLYRPNTYVHIKRYTRSAGLSHLFNQGKVSAELVCSDNDFRQKAARAVESEGGSFASPEVRPNTSDMHIVFGVVSASNSELKLPFFSQVALKNTVHFLKNTLNVKKVSLIKIQATD